MVVSAQKWLDKNYPLESRNQITKLDVSKKELEGDLDLRDFANLEKLDCSFNQLTSLNIAGLKKLEILMCNDNYLNDLDYSSLEPDKLTLLKLNNNNLHEQNLLAFEKFVNLLALWIGTSDEEKIKKNLYNRFSGSLKPLKNLKKLKLFFISNTDINGGIEYLPRNIDVRSFYYSIQERPESKLKEITEKLNHFLNKKFNWKDIHPNFEWGGWDEWEKRGFTYEETKEWVECGFEPYQSGNVKEWKDYGFTSKEVKEWIKMGLKVNEADFAIYLKQESYNPQKQTDNLDALRKYFYQAQNYLDWKFPKEKRKEISELDISWKFMDREKKLKGSLKVEGFNKLEALDCSLNEITCLTFANLPWLRTVKVSENGLRNLTINNCLEIRTLWVSGNKLTNLDFLSSIQPEKLISLGIRDNELPRQSLTIFSQFVNLNELTLSKNSFFGSLDPLQNLGKLKKLSIDNTHISSGLEYLPNSLDELSCKGTELEKELKPYENEFYIWKKYHLVKVLKEENKKIESLEDEIVYLTELIGQQKEKIVQAFLRFAPEKELLRKVIIAYLEYSKARKKEMPAVSLRKQFEKLRNELEEKVEEKFAEEIETILNDCEGLASLELELENEIVKRKKLLEDAYQKVLSITVNINEKIEAGGNIYIANILKYHSELENSNREGTVNLAEILEKTEIQEQALITKNDIKAPVSTQGGHVIIGSYVGGSIIDKVIDKRIISQSIVDVKGSVEIGGNFAPEKNTSTREEEIDNVELQIEQPA